MEVLKNRTNLCLVLLIFFLSTRASGLSLSNFFLFGSLLLNISIAASRKIRIDKSFVLFFVLLSVVILQNFVELGEYFDVFRYLKFLSLILTAYLTIKIVRMDFFVHFNKIVYYTIWFSIPFYLWQLVSVESLHQVGKSMNAIFSGLMDVSTISGNESLNILFYTIEFVENFRNSGPMWEPGGFATVIVLALFFELLQNNFKFTKVCWVFVLGVLITFSTTGYITALVVIFFFLSKKAQQSSSRFFKPLLYMLLPAFLVTTVIVFLNAPIFYEKIITEITMQSEMIKNLSDYGDKFQSLGRFGSLQVDLSSLEGKFLFGRGYTDENFREKYENLYFTNGLSSFIGRMGLVGLAWLLFSLFKSGKLVVYGLSGSGSGSLTYLLLVIIIAFSNPVLFTPLFLVLQLFFIPFKPHAHAKYQAGYSDSSS
ncbi:MAG TPA: hypothetical protein VEZ17_00670 [Chitinophagaceae bacterium]|nr:hypothetical protein [Chitinophagaceae bacterium]